MKIHPVGTSCSFRTDKLIVTFRNLRTHLKKRN